MNFTNCTLHIMQLHAICHLWQFLKLCWPYTLVFNNDRRSWLNNYAHTYSVAHIHSIVYNTHIRNRKRSRNTRYANIVIASTIHNVYCAYATTKHLFNKHVLSMWQVHACTPTQTGLRWQLDFPSLAYALSHTPTAIMVQNRLWKDRWSSMTAPSIVSLHFRTLSKSAAPLRTEQLFFDGTNFLKTKILLLQE